MFMCRSGSKSYLLACNGEQHDVRQTVNKFALTFGLVAALVAGTAISSPDAEAARRKFRPVLPEIVAPIPGMLELAQSDEGGFEEDGGSGGVSIRPREAARIAKSAYPGSKVLKVKLLPSGVYAVTLRGDGELTRVMVDGESGNIL